MGGRVYVSVFHFIIFVSADTSPVLSTNTHPSEKQHDLSSHMVEQPTSTKTTEHEATSINRIIEKVMGGEAIETSSQETISPDEVNNTEAEDFNVMLGETAINLPGAYE